jgi:phosphoribosylanthranilate isomerase
MVACDAGVDSLGFNFSPEAQKRNRYIEPELACAIIEKLPPFVSTVGVCVNATVEEMEEYLEFVHCVQLHGEESVEDTAVLGNRAIKAFRLSQDISIEQIKAYNSCSAYLVDAYSPNERGGTGETCDWNKAAEIAVLTTPLMLAGGLTPDNVAQSIERVRPYAVDTAGGVESEPGIKDHERIRAFIHNAKQASLS